MAAPLIAVLLLLLALPGAPARAVELVLESGAINGEHVLNVLARLQHPARTVQTIATAMTLRQPPASDPARYDGLRQEVGHVDA